MNKIAEDNYGSVPYDALIEKRKALLEMLNSGKATYYTAQRYKEVEEVITFIEQSRQVANLTKEQWKAGWKAGLGAGVGNVGSQINTFSHESGYHHQR